MIVRRLAARRLARTGSTEEEPRRKRAARFLLAIFVAAALSGIAAWLNIPPFGSVHALISQAVGSGAPQLPAQTVFPPVQAVHKVVDVYDPPPPARQTAPPAVSSPSPNPKSTPTPRQSPPPDD